MQTALWQAAGANVAAKRRIEIWLLNGMDEG
jgi:hypothetical protein